MIDFSKIPKRGKKKLSKKPGEEKTPASDASASSEDKKPSGQQGLSFSQIKPEAKNKDFHEKSLSKKGREVYKEALFLADQVLTSSGAVPSVDASKMAANLESLVALTESGAQDLLSFVFSEGEFEGHYLSFNMVNVCILSLELGCWFGLRRDELMTLGQAAFFHDIGMRGCLDVASSSRRLSLSEFQKVKRHPLEGSQILKKLKPDIDPYVVSCIEQEHERINGSGYPRGLKEEQVDQWAQMIGLCDVYEALTHKRPFRPAYNIQEAVKILLSLKDGFSRRTAKAFLERIGLYPKGTLVKLNSDELAYVVCNNPNAPIGPMVSVVFDAQGKRLEAARQIDLSKNPSFYIV